MRVKCANCQMIYNRDVQHQNCIRCGSNAYDMVQAKPVKRERQDETRTTTGPRLLLDDMPSRNNQLNG